FWSCCFRSCHFRFANFWSCYFRFANFGFANFWSCCFRFANFGWFGDRNSLLSLNILISCFCPS
ncbi:pentapeptide repeat-containing protein, partial [Geitlerinema calcuttense]|uniref:pentapeptide repeat-containing protein n=1 Tax=Geitlerinema calcuttense TaxID=1471433 RepID=UPI003D817C5D